MAEQKKPGLLETFQNAAAEFGPGLIAGMGTGDPKQIYEIYTRDRQNLRNEMQNKFNRKMSVERARQQMAQAEQQAIRINQAETRLDLERKKEARLAKLAALKEGKEAQLSGKQVEQLAAMSSVQRQIEDIKRLKETADTGPFVGRFQNLMDAIGIPQQKEFIGLRTQLASLLANYTKSISGAQVSEPERRRLENVIPTYVDQPKTFDDKMLQFERLVQIGGQATLDAIRTGQPLKTETALEMLRSLDMKLDTATEIGGQRSYLDKLKAKRQQRGR